MKIPVFFFILLMLWPNMAGAENVVRQTLNIENSANPRMVCQNPKFNFSQQEMEVCQNVAQTCMRPDLHQADREQCIVAAVRKGMASGGPAGAKNQGNPGATGPTGPKAALLDFSFNQFQALDLIEICEQKQNKNRPLCASAILPNKAKIISDISKARQQ